MRGRPGFRLLMTAACALAGAASPACAAPLAMEGMAGHVAAAASAAAALSVVWALRLRSRLRRQTLEMEAGHKSAMIAADALEALTLARADGALIWRGSELTGAAGFAEGAARRAAMNGPEAWRAAAEAVAPADKAGALAAAMRRLCEEGSPFDFDVDCLDGRRRRAEGRAVGGRAVVRLLDETAARRALKEKADEASNEQREKNRLQSALDQAPMLIWRRDRSGRLTWVNALYARAVEAPSMEAAIKSGAELLSGEKSGTAALARLARESGRPQRAKRRLGVGGALRSYEILETLTEEGSLGFALDLTREAEAEQALKRHTEAFEQTLDGLRAGVAIFDREERLQFYNAAVAKLWGLGDAALDARPTLPELFDLLRQKRRIPEERDFGRWRAEQLRQIRAVAEHPLEAHWHLPEGRAIHALWRAHPLGGAVAVFEDVSEIFGLKSQYKSARYAQRAMLSHLREGVALFGGDGALMLANKAFIELWRLPGFEEERPHVAEIARLCAPLYADGAVWEELTAQVTGAGEARRMWRRTLARSDGSVVELAAAPLPDGGTLVTTLETGDAQSADLTLRDHALSMERAARARSRFMQAISATSQELRTPLNTISGFAESLAHDARGPLNHDQHEAVSAIFAACHELGQLINDLIDLARLEADEQAPHLETLALREALEPILRPLADQAEARRVEMRVEIPGDLGEITADATALRHAVHNIVRTFLSNARPGRALSVRAERGESEIRVRVTGLGFSLPSDVGAALAQPRDPEDWPELSAPGMKLALARRILRRNGGELELRAEGRDVEALARLRIAPPPEAAASPKPAPPR